MNNNYYVEQYKLETNKLIKNKNNINHKILNKIDILDDNIITNILKFTNFNVNVNAYGRNITKNNFLMNYYYTKIYELSNINDYF